MRKLRKKLSNKEKEIKYKNKLMMKRKDKKKCEKYNK